MHRTLLFAAAILPAALAASPAQAADWLTAPSYYTHDRVTGHRVAQFAPVGPYYYYARPDYLRSGYRHFRSTIQAGGSADNMHLVEEWGRPVRPYEEWRFPYRPYSVPYDQWGLSFNGLGPGGVYAPGGYGGFGPYPQPGGYGGGFGQGHGHGYRSGPPANYAQPWLDGYYPQYDQRDRSPYYEPYRGPRP